MFSKSLIVICSVFMLLNLTSCTSMKTLDLRADAAVQHWKGKPLEEFVKANPEIDVFQVVDLGGGKKTTRLSIPRTFDSSRTHIQSFRRPKR